MAIVYKHTRLDKNEPFYIGIGKTEKRAYSKIGRNNRWNKIIKKTNYIIEIIHFDLTWEEACEKEKELIKLYGRKDLGTGTLINMTDGGEGVVGRRIYNDGKYDWGKVNKLMNAIRIEYKIPQHILNIL